MAASRPLPPVEQVPEEGACCAACAGESRPAGLTARASDPAGPPVARTSVALPVIDRGRPPIARDDDRRITFGGLAVAVILVAAAGASLLLPAADRRGLWLPLHLALAGAAGSAIASVLPFFTAALAVARPAGTRLRIGAVGLTAVGAICVSAGVVANAMALAVVGGGTYLAGLGALSWAAFMPLREALGPRRRLVERAYATAIAQVCVGVAVATAMLAGAAPVVERWVQLKPAHAWLNVMGFLTVIVAATLIHLAPTVAGTRIRPRRSAGIAVAALVSGPVLVAAGFAMAADALARLGAVVELFGGGALMAHAVVVARDRGRWTTDMAWHRFAIGSLTAAPAWLLLAVVFAAGPVLVHGADPAAWRIETVAAPLALGWLAQVLAGSWSHLLPSIGPGDMAVHARQRQILGRAALARWVTLNAGVGVAVLGSQLAVPAPAIAGLAAVLLAMAANVALFAHASLAGRVVPRTPGTAAERAAVDQPGAVPGGG